MEKIWLFIDYANLLASLKRRNIEFIDFEKLIKYIEIDLNWSCLNKFIYFAYPENWTRNYEVSWIHKFWVFLNKWLGFNVIKKPLKQIELRDEDWKHLYDNDEKIIIKEKWNLDIELTMDIMLNWMSYDIIVLFSWDSDFKCLTEFLLNNWKLVYIYSTIWNISNELMENSTEYFDIKDLPKDIVKYKIRKLQ